MDKKARDEKLQEVLKISLDRAALLERMGDWHAALKELEYAYSLFPSLASEPYALALLRRGKERERAGDLAEARRVYQLAFRIAPDGKIKDYLKRTITDLGVPSQPVKSPQLETIQKPKTYASNMVKIMIWIIPVILIIAIILIRQGGLAVDQKGGNYRGIVIVSTPNVTRSPTPYIDKTATWGVIKMKTAIAQDAISNTATSVVSTEVALEKSKTVAAKTSSAKKTAERSEILQATENMLRLEEAGFIVCEGNRAEDAASYLPGKVFHPVIIYPDKYRIPADAMPERVSELELVACISSEETIMGNYRYERDHFCISKKETLTISIFEAKTGKLVNRFRLYGPTPVCEDVESFKIGENTLTKVGYVTDLDQIWELIKPYINLDLKQ